MGKKYKASIPAQRRKHHACVGCGSHFSYLLQRKVTAEGSTAEKAAAEAERKAEAELASAVDAHACPTCGLVQPDMIADMRLGLHIWAMVITVFGLLIALVIGLVDPGSLSIAAYAAMAVPTLGLLLSGAACFRNPNRHLDANRAASEQKVKAGLLKLEHAPRALLGRAIDEHGGLKTRDAVGLILMAAAVAVAGLAVLVSKSRGWIENTTCYPAVIGPGDTSRIYFDEKITALKSYWSGSAVAKVINQEDPDLPRSLVAATKRDLWGTTISGKDVSNHTLPMWVEVTIPEGDQLTGKELKLDLTASVNYPKAVGSQFQDEFGEFHHVTSVVLSPPGAGLAYFRLFWIGQLASLLLFVTGGVVLMLSCSALSSRARPSPVPEGSPKDPQPVA